MQEKGSLEEKTRCSSPRMTPGRTRSNSISTLQVEYRQKPTESRRRQDSSTLSGNRQDFQEEVQEEVQDEEVQEEVAQVVVEVHEGIRRQAMGMPPLSLETPDSSTRRPQQMPRSSLMVKSEGLLGAATCSTTSQLDAETHLVGSCGLKIKAKR